MSKKRGPERVFEPPRIWEFEEGHVPKTFGHRVWGRTGPDLPFEQVGECITMTRKEPPRCACGDYELRYGTAPAVPPGEE